MSTNLTDDPTSFDATIVVPSDGDDGDAASIQPGLQSLANRTAYLKLGTAIHAAKNWNLSPSTATASATPVALTGIAGNANQWVAVGGTDGTQMQIFVSTNAGASWFQVTGFTSADLYDVAADLDGDVFIAVGASGSGTGYAVIRVAPTSDLTLFTSKSNPKDHDLNAVSVSDSGAAVAAGVYDGSDIYAVLSTDAGDTWVEITSMAGSAGDFVNDIATTGTTFVAVGETTPGGAPLAWVNTTDGAIGGWSAITSFDGLTAALQSVTYDGTQFVAIGDSGETLVSTTGADGTWSLLTGPTVTIIGPRSMRADPASGVIVVMGQTGQLSTDGGVTWSELKHLPAPIATGSGGDHNWNIVAFNGNAWASAYISIATDDMFGIQSLLVE